MAKKVLLFLLCVIPAMPHRAEADLQIEQRTRCEVWIRGEITAADADKLERSECEHPFVMLSDSPGGDARAGMNIGRWIRRNQAPTSVELDRYCYSTCALIFIAGVERFALGTVGLHRPYLAGPPQPAESIPGLVSAMRDEVRKYVAEMGVRPEFASVMLETLPEQIRLYRGSEIHELVAERDPIYDEMEAARNARFHGVSSDEYRRRSQEADSECDLLRDFKYPGGYLDFENCKNAILWGLSRSVYSRRIDAVPDRCRGSAEAFLDSTPEERAANFRDCRIAVMRGE